MPRRRFRRGRRSRFRRRRRFRRGFRRVARFRRKARYLYKRTSWTRIDVFSLSDNFEYTYTLFALQLVPGYLEFTAMFQEYRINIIKWELRPVTTVPVMGLEPNTVTNNTRLTTMPEVWSIPQLYGITESTLNAYAEYPSLRITTGSKVHKRIMKPTVAQPVFVASGTAYSYRKSPWISTLDPDVPHYGIDWAFVHRPVINTTGEDNASRWSGSMKMTYYVQFRRPY